MSEFGNEVVPAVEPIRRTSVNNKWDSEGLLSAKTEQDEDAILCEQTGIPLFYIDVKGTRIMLETFGKCYNCEKTIHVSNLYMSSAVEQAKWPVEYSGRWCQDCWELPADQWREPVDLDRVFDF